MTSSALNILFVGLGGQGVVLASEIIAGMFLSWGLKVKKSEIHGLAQRGGSVKCELRVGQEIHSPTIPRGCCDYLLAFDIFEGRQFVREIRSTGSLLFLEEEEKAKVMNKKTWNMMLIGKFLSHLKANKNLNIEINITKILAFTENHLPPKSKKNNTIAIQEGFATALGH